MIHRNCWYTEHRKRNVEKGKNNGIAVISSRTYYKKSRKEVLKEMCDNLRREKGEYTERGAFEISRET